MGLIMRGHNLNQRQLDAIVAPMNDLMQGKIKGQKKFEEACIDALEAAGCPLGYDKSMPDAGASLADRSTAWLRDGEVGLSSRTIYDHMLGLKSQDSSYPHDPDDLNRCLLLLDLIPEWATRMGEMAFHGKEWKALSERWNEISECFIEEAGLGWAKSKRAPKTYALMKELLKKA